MTLEDMNNLKKERGYSLAQIAELSKVPLGTVQKIFAGITKAPRYATKQAIEQVLLKDNTQFMNSNERSVKYNSDKVCESVPYEAELHEKKQGEYTLEDYYALPDERRVELIDGYIYDMSSPSFVHQSISIEVAFQIKQQIKDNSGKCKVICAPIDVRLDCDAKTMLQPDVLIICDSSKMKKWGIMGSPDWVMEIVSDSSKSRDYFKKMMKYKEAGVKEYWILDPIRGRITVYDFTKESGPEIYPISGELGLAMYDNQIMIDLDEVALELSDYSE